MSLALVNLSREVSSQQLRLMGDAIAVQVNAHAAPAWGWDPVEVSVAADVACAQDGASQVVLVDGLDVLGAYGYHSVGPNGMPYGRVDVAECLMMGGGVLSGVNGVSAVASHEVLELLGDPDVSQWAVRPDGARVPVELCDACQGYTYLVEVDGVTVEVADFLLPAYFGTVAQVGTAKMTPEQVAQALEHLNLAKEHARLTAAIEAHAGLHDDHCPNYRASVQSGLVLAQRGAVAAIGEKLASMEYPGPYDYLGHLTRQWEIGAGGYSVVEVNGRSGQVFGAGLDERSIRRSKLHKTSRTARRCASNQTHPLLKGLPR